MVETIRMQLRGGLRNRPTEGLKATWVILLLIPALCAGSFLRCRVLRDHGPRQYEQLGFDARYYYVSTGIALTEGRGFDAAYNQRDPKPPLFIPPPLQAIFVALVFKITGAQSIWALLIAQLLLNIGSGFLLFLLLFRWKGRVAGLIGFWLWMIYPEFSYWVASPITENNHLVLLITSLWLLMEWERRGGVVWMFAAAVLIGIMNLQKPIGLLLGIWIAIFCLFRLKGGEKWLSFLMFLTVPFLVLMPWMIRNHMVTGDMVWVSSNGGVLFHKVNRIDYDPMVYPDYGVNWRAGEGQVKSIEERFWSDEFRNHRTYSRQGKLYAWHALQYVSRHPIHFMRNNLVKLGQRYIRMPYTLERVLQTPHLDHRTVKLFVFILFYGLLASGLAGLVYVCRHRQEPGNVLMTWCFIYLTGVCTLMHHLSSGRLALGLRLFLVIYATVALLSLWKRIGDPLRVSRNIMTGKQPGSQDR